MLERVRVNIAGSGKVAEALSAAIGSGIPGIEAGEIWSRSESGALLAKRNGFGFCSDASAMNPADLYILAVSDSAVAEVAAMLTIPENAVVAHTAGGVGMDSIPAVNRAVIYPLQTFSEGRYVDLRKVPLFIEYATPRAEEVVIFFASAVSANVNEAGSELRAKLHTAAVFACNFTNYLYTVAARLMTEDGLSFDLLAPLIEETAAKAIASKDPATAQTGPAVRGDMTTMERHIRVLRNSNAPDKERLEEIYKILSQAIWETLKKR